MSDRQVQQSWIRNFCEASKKFNMNDALIGFNPVVPIAFAIAMVVLLLAFFIYREFRRQQKFLAGRIIGSSMVMISLLGVLLHPTYRELKRSDPILLLTKGYQQSKIDSLIQKNPA